MADSRQKILIVEDDPLTAAHLRSTLEGYNYQVVDAITSGEEVLNRIASLQPTLILMDINLAGSLDGIQTAEALQDLVDVPVVFLTALNDEATLQRAKLANPYGYLIKPFEPAELRSTIELTLHRFQKEPKDIEPDFSGENLSETISSAGESLRGLKDAEFLSKLYVFKNVPSKEIDKLSQSLSIKEFPLGEFLMIEGESNPDGLFIPLTGRISITKTADSGKELIVALLAPGDTFGLFYGLPSFAGSSSARAQIDSKVIWFPAAQWNYFAEQVPSVYKNLAVCLAERLATAHTLSSSLAHARVEGRIVNTLIALLPNFGKYTAKSSNDGRIFITRKELAELTGTTPETAIRITKSLEREGILDLTRPGIIKIPNIQSLKAMLAN